MYTLVNDIEHYPSFLPWCHQTQILTQQPEQVTAKVLVKKGMVKQEFVTKNTLSLNERVCMELVEGPFKFLNGEWRFEPKQKGCEVTLYLEFEFANKWLSYSFAPVFNHAAQTMMTCFINRAHKLYGSAHDH